MAISTPTSTLNVNATSFTPNPSKEPRYISVVKSAPSGLMYTAKPASVIYAEQPSLKVVAPNFHRFFNQLSLNHYPFVTNPSFIPCRVSGNQCFEDPSLLGMHPNQIASGARPYCEVLKPNYSPKQYGNHTECLVAGNRPIIPNQFLHPKKQEVENADHTGMTKMHQAAKNGNLWEVDYWCNLGANVNTSDSNGETAIQSAVRAGYLEVVQYLHRLCADLDSMDRHGMSVLHIAVESGHLPVVKFLCELACDIETVNKYGLSLMSTAAKFGHSDIVEYLISVKAPFNKMNKSHMAPIHFAAIRGDGKMVELLASSGAEIDNRDLSGSTPIHYLAWLGKESQKR